MSLYRTSQPAGVSVIFSNLGIGVNIVPRVQLYTNAMKTGLVQMSRYRTSNPRVSVIFSNLAIGVNTVPRVQLSTNRDENTGLVGCHGIVPAARARRFSNLASHYPTES